MKKILVYINLAFFALSLVLMLSGAGWVLTWLKLPSDAGMWLSQPWSLLTYMFLHYDVWHLLFNMALLWWVGDVFLMAFSVRHLAGLYLLGGFVGGALFVLFGTLFPGHTSLFVTGASASVLALSVAAAMRMPELRLRMLLFGEASLKYVVLVLVVLTVIMAGGNMGMQVTHIGGALAGWLFVKGLDKGRDYTSWINRTIDFFVTGWKGKSFSGWKPRMRMKVKYSNTGRNADYEYNARKKEREEEIDRILDKIKEKGYGGLTAEEKKKLFDASKK